MKRRKVVVCGFLVILFGLLTILIFSNSHTSDSGAKDTAVNGGEKDVPHRPAVAVVNFPKTGDKKDAASKENRGPDLFEYNEDLALEKGYGKISPLTAEELKHPQVQSAVEALKSGEHPERLSPLVQGAAFDRERFKTDEAYRKKYLSVAEPGRVFQEDPKGEFRLKRVSQYFQTVEQGRAVKIEVSGQPGMPVSATSFDLGRFRNNGLTYCTEVFDANGIASFDFEGTPGTIADANILVGSPACRGRVKFVVHTLLPGAKERFVEEEAAVKE